MSVVRAKLSEIADHADPRRALLRAVGDVSGIEVFHNLVLVATYIKPPRKIKRDDGTEYEFQWSDQTLAEDRFQGKAALVLKVGPLAFKDDAVAKFGGATVKPGDWVMVNPSNGTEFFKVDDSAAATGTSCRLFEDVHIKARIADPALIY